MAFFGLTSLGDQDPVQHLLSGQSLIPLFNDNDVQLAFNKVEKGGTIRQRQLEDFMRELYHGSLFGTDLDKLRGCFSGTAVLTLIDLQNSIKRLQADIREERSREYDPDNPTKRKEHPARETCSVWELEYRIRHHTVQNHPQKKFSAPVTSFQEIGWHCGAEIPDQCKRGIVHARKQCEETAFAAELIRNGVI